VILCVIKTRKRNIPVTDTRIERPAYAIHRKQVRGETLTAQNSIRVYNYSPGLVMVQVRGKTSYIGVTLPLPDVERLIGMLTQARAGMYPDAVIESQLESQ
jgi:hypothetical protein